MKDGRFIAFDVVALAGRKDLRPLPLRGAFKRIGRHPTGELLRPDSGQGGEFLEAVLADQGRRLRCQIFRRPMG